MQRWHPAATERERIMRERLDVAGQSLYAICLKLQRALRAVTEPAAVEQLEAALVLASQGVADVRRAVYALSALDVRESGLIPSLRTLARRSSRDTGAGIEVRVRGPIPELPAQAQDALYRVAHEALLGAERHARATGVVIVLSALDGSIELSIRDDGVGLDQREVPHWRSFSRLGMRAAAGSIEAAGGRFAMTPVSPRGIHVCARVPIPVSHRATS